LHQEATAGAYERGSARQTEEGAAPGVTPSSGQAANALAKQPRSNKHSARALQQRATTGDVKHAARTGHAVREARCPPKETCGSRETLTSRTCPQYTRVSRRVHVPSTLSPTLDWLEGRSRAGRSCHFIIFSSCHLISATTDAPPVTPLDRRRVVTM